MSTSRTHGRRVWLVVWQNFIKSFRGIKAEKIGECVGEDLFGNKFYENTYDLTRGKKLPRRSFESAKDMHFDVENMSAEWDAWLRHRRKVPPTIEELKANAAIAQAKQENARKLAQQEGKDIEDTKHIGMHSFPTYEDYEVNPGKGHTKFDDDRSSKSK